MDCYRFDTLAAHPSDRVEAWRSVNRRFFGDLAVEALGDRAMDAQLSAYEVGRLKVFSIDGPPHRVSRDDARRDMPIDDYFKLVLQLQGRGRIEQADGHFDLHEGDWSLYDPRVPYSITNRDASRLLVVQVPRSSVAALRVPTLHTCEARSPQAVGLNGVLGSFLLSLSGQLPTLPNAAGGPISDTVLNLLASTVMLARADRSPIPMADVLRERVKHYVNLHLGDPDLDLDRIAAHMRCSKRYLHRVFEAEDCSLDRFIWQARLQRCHDALASLPGARRSISEIAFAWGFNSTAHFSRLFRQRYGMTPRLLRSRTLAGSG